MQLNDGFWYAWMFVVFTEYNIAFLYTVSSDIFTTVKVKDISGFAINMPIAGIEIVSSKMITRELKKRCLLTNTKSNNYTLNRGL